MDSFQEFTSKWITPATLVIMFGAIVWGIQLNVAVMQNAKAIAALTTTLEGVKEKQAEHDLAWARAVVIQDQLLERLAINTETLNAHLGEAEDWKRRILMNEQRVSP